MDTLTLDVASRDLGKKATKAVRNAGRVPCVLYGHSTPPVHFSVEQLDLRPLIFTTENYLVAVEVDGEAYEAILKEVTFHPVTDQPLHADFQALTRGESLSMTVPISLTGNAPGVKAGGLLSQPLNELEIRCLPKDIPGHFDVDVSMLEVGDSIHVRELGVGDAIEILTDPDRTIVTITAPRVVEETAEEDALADGVEPTGEATEEVPEAGGDADA